MSITPSSPDSKAKGKVKTWVTSQWKLSDLPGQLSVEINNMTFDQMDWQDQFDGIWASACLLHVARADLLATFGRFAHALTPAGAWYLSMKEGDATRQVEGRTFTDVTDAELQDLLEAVGLRVQEIWLSADVRPEREDRWVNAIAIKP